MEGLKPALLDFAKRLHSGIEIPPGMDDASNQSTARNSTVRFLQTKPTASSHPASQDSIIGKLRFLASIPNSKGSDGRQLWLQVSADEVHGSPGSGSAQASTVRRLMLKDASLSVTLQNLPQSITTSHWSSSLQAEKTRLANDMEYSMKRAFSRFPEASKFYFRWKLYLTPSAASESGFAIFSVFGDSYEGDNSFHDMTPTTALTTTVLLRLEDPNEQLPEYTLDPS